MDDYLSKPINAVEMSAKLERWNTMLLKEGRAGVVHPVENRANLQPA